MEPTGRRKLAAYEESRKWVWEEDAIEEVIAGLREAGMNIPPEAPAVEGNGGE